MMKTYTVAVAGAMGAVGTEMLKNLESRNFPVGEIRPLDVGDNVGREILFKGQPVKVQQSYEEAFAGVDIALFAVGAGVSRALAPAAGERGAVFAGLNLTLGCFNLLPVGALDGGRALRALLPLRWEEAARGISGGLSALLSAAGFLLMLHTGNPTLFLTGGWLALLAVRGEREEASGQKMLAIGWKM